MRNAFANLSRSVANSDERIADLESDLEHAEYVERIARDPKHLEHTDLPARDDLTRSLGRRREAGDEGAPTLFWHFARVNE